MARSLAPLLVGREDALVALAAQLDEALAGHGRIIFLSGEAGIGKTRLTREFLEQAHQREGVDYLVGHCFESDAAVPYAPFVSALAPLRRRLGHTFDEHIRGYATELAPLLSEEHEPSQEGVEPSVARRRLFAAVTQTLATTGAQSGRVIVLEDLHWCDGASRELLLHLARGIEDERVLLLCTYRSEALERHHPLARVIAELERERRCVEIRLEPLNLSESKRLLDLTLERSTPGPFVALLHERAGGNPFFMEELLRSLIDHGKLDRCLSATTPASVLEQAGIPLSIRASILGHLAELNPTARAMARTAAVLGRTFDFELLQALTRLPEEALTDAIASCIEHQLMVDDPAAPGERYRFRHALTRETLYGDLSGRERLLQHRAAVEHFEALAETDPDATLEALAYHSLHARDGERARRYARRAGDRAMRLFAYRDALAQYEASLSLTPESAIADRAEIHTAIATALRPLRRHNEYTEHWRVARDLYAQIPDRQREAALCLELASAAWEAGESARTFTLAQEAIDLLSAAHTDPCELARAYAMVTRLHMVSHHVAAVAEWGERALAAAQGCGDERIAAGVTVSMGFARHLSSDVDEGVALLQRGLELAQRSGSWIDVCRAYVNMSDAAYDRGDFEQVFALHEANQRNAEQTGWELTLPATLYNVGRAHLALGRVDEASALAAELLIACEASVPAMLPLILALRTKVLIRRELPTEAIAPVERAVALAERDGIFEKICAAYEGLISARLSLGDMMGAALAAARALDFWRPLGPCVGNERLLLVAVEALLVADQRSAAAEPFGTLGQLSERARTLFARAAFAEAQALLAEYDGDPMRVQLWADAATAWHALDMPYQEQRAGARATGQTFAASSSRARADPNSSQASGARPCPLTRREREVLAAVARGENTTQIAAALVLSEHTVHRHVANILTKLDTPTRAAAVALAAREGWL